MEVEKGEEGKRNESVCCAVVLGSCLCKITYVNTLLNYSIDSTNIHLNMSLDPEKLPKDVFALCLQP